MTRGLVGQTVPPWADRSAGSDVNSSKASASGGTKRSVTSPSRLWIVTVLGRPGQPAPSGAIRRLPFRGSEQDERLDERRQPEAQERLRPVAAVAG